MKSRLLKITMLSIALFGLLGLWANNLEIKNVGMERFADDDYALVRFDVGWDISWSIGGGTFEDGSWVLRGDPHTIAVYEELGSTAIISGTYEEIRIKDQINCISHLNVPCGSLIRSQDLLTTDITGIEHFFGFELRDEFGRRVSNPLPQRFTGKIWAHVTDSRTGATCETEIEVSDKPTCSIVNTLDTTLWCVDDFLDVDVLSDFYKDTLKLRPVAMDGCSGDTLGYAEYDGEWVTTFECGPSTGSGQGDTLKQILRRWYWENKDGSECSAFDTLTLIRLPNIAEYIYAPQKDTVSCVYDTILDSTEIYSEVCWKQMVGLHSDGTMIYYPLDETDRATADEVLIIRGNGFEEDVDYVRMNYAVVSYRGKQSYEVPVREGDRVLSNDSRFVHVDEDWFYLGDGSQHVTWVDICVPFISYRVETTICDVWAEDACAGIKLILPDHPYDPDSCKIYCLDELSGSGKCVDVLHLETEEFSGSCPKIDKQYTTIKQSCFAEGAGLARLDALPSMCALDTNTSGIESSSTSGGSLFVEVEQWIIYEDTLGPLPNEKEREIRYTTDAHSCEGEIEIPSILLKDQCSGVKRVRATFLSNGLEQDIGWVQLSDEDGDGVWEQSEGTRTFRLAYGGPYEVRYQAIDECHNALEVDLHEIYVEDRSAPTVITDDNVGVSLGGKEVWLDASTFDQGSSDNCGIVKTLVRRADWLEVCDIDVCLEGLSEIKSEAELERFIASNGITAGLESNEIERGYAEQYEWLLNDGEWCEDDYVREQLLLGWEEDIKNAWIEEGCIGVDEHNDRLISEGVDVRGTSKGVNRDAGGLGLLSTTNNSILGGGWGNAVPICCEDACSEVIVEVLMIDKDCNFTLGWVTVEVEDKSAVTEACTFEPVTISCAAYAENYAGLIDAAVAAGNNSDVAPAEFAAVDEALGPILKGWRSDDNTLVDSEGNALNKNWTFQTASCEYRIDTTRTLVQLHDGTSDWVTTFDTSVEMSNTQLNAQLGGVYVLCGAQCEQDIWPVLNDCGVGTVTRRWRVYSGCTDAHRATPLMFEQVIHIAPTCELKKALFSFPADTALMGALTYDESGNVDIDGGQLEYTLDDAGCRNMGIDYEDEVLEVQDQEDEYKIHRTWIIRDWCTSEEISYVQKIELTAGQPMVSGNVTGAVVTSYDEGRVGQVDMIANLSNGETVSSMTGSNGVYSLNIPQGLSATLSPVKDINLTNGVDIVDMLAIKNHVLGRAVLRDQYKQIAADVNNDQVINSKDFAAIQAVALGNASTFPNNKSWRFFNEASGQETVTITGSTEVQSLNFMGVKTGDVDFKNTDLSRSASKVVILAEDVSLAAGQISSITLNSDKALAGYQFALRYDATKLDVVAIQGIEPSDWVKLGTGEIRVMAASSLRALALAVRAKADVSVRDAIAIGSSADFVGIAVGEDASVHGVELAFASPNGFQLYQNRPNPFVDQSVIRFRLPETTRAKLTLFDASGRILQVIEKTYAAGVHEEVINARDLGSRVGGVIYYQLDTDTHSATKQMVRLR